MSDYKKVIRERSDLSKRTEDNDHKEVLTFTLRSDEEHVRAVTKQAVNNMASSFELSAHPYVLSNLFTGLHAKMDLHNSLLESISAREEKQESFASPKHHYNHIVCHCCHSNDGVGCNLVHLTHQRRHTSNIISESRHCCGSIWKLRWRW